MVDEVSRTSWLIPMERVISNNYNMIPTELMFTETISSGSSIDLINELDTNEQKLKHNLKNITFLMESIVRHKELIIKKCRLSLFQDGILLR